MCDTVEALRTHINNGYALSLQHFRQAIDEGLVKLAPSRTAVDKDGHATEFFWNLDGRQGNIMLCIGDVTKDAATYQQPYVSITPSKHKDAKDEACQYGMFTSLADPQDQADAAYINEWMYQQMFEHKVVKGKLGASIEALKLGGVAPLFQEPDGADPKQKWSFWQKIRRGGNIPDLETKAIYVVAVPDPTPDNPDKKKAKKVRSFDPLVGIRKGSKAYSLVELSKVKMLKGKMGSVFYTRCVMTDPPAKRQAAVPKMGGSALDLDAESEEEDGDDDGDNEAEGCGVGDAASTVPNSGAGGFEVNPEDEPTFGQAPTDTLPASAAADLDNFQKTLEGMMGSLGGGAGGSDSSGVASSGARGDKTSGPS